jgi:hypothetical protein
MYLVVNRRHRASKWPWQYSGAMKSARRALWLAVIGTIALVTSLGGFGIAPAAAAPTYTVTSAIEQGAKWLTFSDTPLYSNEPKVTPGVHNFRVTLANNSTQAVSITHINLGIPAAPMTCVTKSIAVGKSGSCTVKVTIVAGPLSFGLTSYLSNNQTFVSATHVLIGVSYSLTTTMLVNTPTGLVSPGDASLLTLPLGFIPSANLTIHNGSTVTLTSLTVPGFDTSACASQLAALLSNTVLLCNGVTAITPASSTPVVLKTGAIGDGVFPGDRVGLGVALSYQGSGGCAATLPSVDAGSSETISCTGFDPNIEVGAVMHSSAVSLGSQLIQPDGSLIFTFTVPATTTGGSHHVSMTVHGTTVTTAPFTVVASLPETGNDPTQGLLTAFALLVLGFGLAMGSWTRRSAARQRIVRPGALDH